MMVDKIKNNLWKIINSIFLLGLILFLVSNSIQDENSQIVYINNTKVFNGFNMTKDLLKVNQKTLDVKTKRLDSLLVIARKIEQDLNTKRNITEKDKQEYATIQNKVVNENKEVKEMQKAISQDINQQVWNRLNEYVKSFGKENNSILILGTQGRGNIMYANEAIDFTDEFLEYTNKKYEGN